MLKHFLLLLVAAISIQAATVYAQEKRPEVSRYVKAYSGAENTIAWTTRIGPESNNEALLQFFGIDHPLDLKILKVSVEHIRGEYRYIIQKNDPQYPEHTVLVLNNEGSGTVFLPKSSRSFSVRYDKSLSEQGNSERFLSDYLIQEQGKK